MPCAIRIFSESCPEAVSTGWRLDRLSVILRKTLLNCEICLMNKASFLAFIFLLPFGVDGGELRNTYYWYCLRCKIRDSYTQSMDEIIENRPPAKPSYNSRNCADAYGSTYCCWVLGKDTIKVLVDEITEYRERKNERAKSDEYWKVTYEFRRTNNKSSYQIIQEARGREYVEPALVFTNEATEKVKNFNTDLVAPAAPFEVLKK